MAEIGTSLNQEIEPFLDAKRIAVELAAPTARYALPVLTSVQSVAKRAALEALRCMAAMHLGSPYSPVIHPDVH